MASSVMSFVLFCIFALCAVPGDASAFLHVSKHTPEELVAIQAVQQALLEELLAGAGPRHAKHLADLTPMYTSLPKTEQGTLAPAAVRYALHRYFVQRHGWYVKGLEPAGGAWNSSTPTGIMTDRVPSYIQDLLETRLGGHGFGLRELAAFAAALEELVHQEAVNHLEGTYDLLGLPIVGRISPSQLEQVVGIYMMTYILGSDVSGMTQEDLRTQQAEVAETYPGWQDTLMWAIDTKSGVEFRDRHRNNPFTTGVDFAEASRIVEEFGEGFGSFQNAECRGLKETLMGLEYKDTGRVRLSDFYRGGLNEHWQFTESADYLRNLGALDESDPRRPSVIISNYVNSQSNCLASSNFYSVCCIDECEALLGHLERELAAPSAAPASIAAIVGGLASDTVDAPRNLSSSLLERLNEIASHHDGKVPLHGRLFSQWMHHAYPRECPFPHAAGTTHPLTPDEWMATKGQDSLAASEDEMRKHVESASNHSHAFEEEHAHLPWSTVEELVVSHKTVLGTVRHESPTGWMGALRSAAALAALTSAAVQVAKMSRSAISAGSEKDFVHFKDERHMV